MARNEEKLRVATQSFVAANEMVRTPYCLHKIPTHGSGTLRIVVCTHRLIWRPRKSQSYLFDIVLLIAHPLLTPYPIPLRARSGRYAAPS